MEQLGQNIGVYVTNKAEDTDGKQHTAFAQLESYIWRTEAGRFVFGEQRIPFGNTVYIGQLNQIEDVETSGDNVYGWTHNYDALNKIKQEAIANKIQNKDVYLLVLTSKERPYYIHSWYWSDATKMESLSLENIKKGFLGQDYANKTIEICNADYTTALKKGYANLCEYLKKRLKEDVLKGAPKEIKTYEEAIKRIIDSLYEQLKMYDAPRIYKKKVSTDK